MSAAGLTNGDKELLNRIGTPKLTVPSNHYTRLLAAGKSDQRHATPGFMDDAEYTYYSHFAKAGGKPPREVRFKLVYDTYTEPMLFRYWSDNAPVPPGINRFDLAGGPYGKNGKFESYRSQKPVALGSRFGPQNMVVSAWALQMLDDQPGLWDKAVAQLYGKDLRVGSDPGPTEGFELGGRKLAIVRRSDGLLVFGRPAGDTTVEIVGPSGKAVISLPLNKATTAVNGSGEKLQVKGVATAGNDAEPPQFRFTIPYTVVKDQGQCLNGVELGRYTITVGKESKSFVLASSEKQVRVALEKELAGGLRTWEAIFEAKGFIPTSLGAGAQWDNFSDSGGYAHLISAASQYILWKQKKRDWETRTK